MFKNSAKNSIIYLKYFFNYLIHYPNEILTLHYDFLYHNMTFRCTSWFLLNLFFFLFSFCHSPIHFHSPVGNLLMRMRIFWWLPSQLHPGRAVWCNRQRVWRRGCTIGIILEWGYKWNEKMCTFVSTRDIDENNKANEAGISENKIKFPKISTKTSTMSQPMSNANRFWSANTRIYC